MTDPVAADIRSASRWGLLLGILTLVFGFLCIGSPLVSGLAVATVVGILLIMAGISQLIFAFQAGSVGRGIFVFLFGGITILGGIAVVGRPLLGLATITLVLVWYFIFDGVSGLITAFRTNPPRGRGWLIFGSIVSIVLGLMLWRDWPLSGAWAVGVLVGIRLIFRGWSMIMLSGMGSAMADDMEERN